ALPSPKASASAPCRRVPRPSSDPAPGGARGGGGAGGPPPRHYFMRLRVPWPDTGEVVIAGHRRVRFATLNPPYAPALEAEHVMLSPPSISCVNGPRRKIG